MTPLRLACIDAEAPPLFLRSPDGVTRRGYEPDAAALVAEVLGRPLEWVFTPWAEMIPAARAHRVDAVWCGQGITARRLAQADFTRPYAIFNESVLVRPGAGVAGPRDLRGRRVAAIAGSTNMALAETFPGAVTVPFGGDTDDVFGDMLAALRRGEVDAVVDDDVVFAPLDDGPDFEVAFTVPTGNRWGVAVAKDRPDILAAIDGALATVIADGRLEKAWRAWMPGLDYPLGGG
ncbi:ABC transporter substrate-binding protein [Actinomadura kijaniata]|uniref:Polar amino acid transport system substrate-binding protein n=1 Tax=Actinomadura namibiensis TaxID=182080 RepID=A0A7W3QMI9_ACTNM|nr:ABC transporter substrate-binding protein [Actinomadura namibiensis]MBA8952619.1 polar amino acid transport system substrate-binding protein [Actinomadura namibiensis]